MRVGGTTVVATAAAKVGVGVEGVAPAKVELELVSVSKSFRCLQSLQFRLKLPQSLMNRCCLHVMKVMLL